MIRILVEFIHRQSKRRKNFIVPDYRYHEEFSSSSEESSKSDIHKLDKMFHPDKHKDKIVISVIDNGVGIQREDRKKLFQLFGKIASTRGMNTNGIGLGLVISENIVKCFDGSIGVRSRYGYGSRFAFSIVLDDMPTSDEDSVGQEE